MYADAVKAIGKGNPDAVRRSLAFQALSRIGTIFDIEGKLKSLSPEERLRERKKCKRLNIWYLAFCSFGSYNGSQ